MSGSEESVAIAQPDSFENDLETVEGNVFSNNDDQDSQQMDTTVNVPAEIQGIYSMVVFRCNAQNCAL